MIDLIMLLLEWEIVVFLWDEVLMLESEDSALLLGFF